MRINKFIASSGIVSRRKADELIKEGKVKVNGEIITTPGHDVGPKDKVKINGELLRPKKFEYLIFHKPPGYITTKSDEKGRKTIYDLLPEEYHHLNPAGRLDKDSTGLLFLSNDGYLVQKMTHPKAHIPKIYLVHAKGKINSIELQKLVDGIEIEEGKIAYADVCLIESTNAQTTLQMTLFQGYNRQIRKMLDAVGHPVISLKRIAHGNLTLQNLERGKFKVLKPKQVTDLKNYVKKVLADNNIPFIMQ